MHSEREDIITEHKEAALIKLKELADAGELEAIEFCIREGIDKTKYLQMLHDIMNDALGESHQVQAAKKLYKLTGNTDTNKGNYYSGI